MQQGIGPTINQRDLWRRIWTLTEPHFALGWSSFCACGSMSCVVRWISLELFPVLSCNLYFCTSLVDCVVTETSLLPAASSPSSLDTEGELRGKTLSPSRLYSVMDAAALVAVFVSRLVMQSVHVEAVDVTKHDRCSTPDKQSCWCIKQKEQSCSPRTEDVKKKKKVFSLPGFTSLPQKLYTPKSCFNLLHVI